MFQQACFTHAPHSFLKNYAFCVTHFTQWKKYLEAG
jgi:hypothetical protein